MRCNLNDSDMTAVTSLNKYQQRVVELMANVNSDQQMAEITSLLSRYFAQKAIDAVDALWDKGLIDENTIEQWKHEHMRTPYSE